MTASWFKFHCPQCEADYTPYIRVGDVIDFWSPAHRSKVKGKVSKVEGKTYTIDLNGAPCSIVHQPGVGVGLISRRGLPTTTEEHLAYFRKHHMSAPNVTMEARLQVMRLHREGKL